MQARNSSNIAKQVVVIVEKGTTKSVVNSDQSDRGSAESYKPFDTIDKIFDIIEHESRIRHDVFTVKYDTSLGYPIEVISDEDIKGADEKFAITVVSLKAK